MQLIHLKIPISFQDNNQFIQHQWTWFRKNLILYHQLRNLPLSFEKNEGTITENFPYEEDDIMYDMTAIEYNYYWRNQKLQFEEKNYLVSIEVESSDYGSYCHFTLEIIKNNYKVGYFLSNNPQTKKLSLSDSTNQSGWEIALAELAELDRQHYENIHNY